MALLRELIRAELAGTLTSEIGVVEAAESHAGDMDAVNYGCDVRLRGRDVVLKSVPLATGHLGTVAMPAAGDLVLVHFVGGDAAQPVIGGRYYSDELRPPPYDEGQIVTYLPPGAGETDRIEATMQGGKNGSRSWIVSLPSDVSLTLTDTKIEVKAGPLSVVLDADAGEATVKTSHATVTVKDGGDVAVQGDGNLSLSASGNVEIKAGGSLKLEASGTAEMKGSVVNIN